MEIHHRSFPNEFLVCPRSWKKWVDQVRVHVGLEIRPPWNPMVLAPFFSIQGRAPPPMLLFLWLRWVLASLWIRLFGWWPYTENDTEAVNRRGCPTEFGCFLMLSVDLDILFYLFLVLDLWWFIELQLRSSGNINRRHNWGHPDRAGFQMAEPTNRSGNCVNLSASTLVLDVCTLFSHHNFWWW